MLKNLHAVAASLAVSFIAIAAQAQIHRVAEMRTEQIRALDKSHTVVLLPAGILEQHGPHLPSFSDGYMNEWLTVRLAEDIVQRDGWSALIFPTIPLGTGGANEIGQKFSFPGTYAVRSSTLRSVFMDLADELGEQGFKWVFMIHGHGAPNHNRALDDAGDYFRDTYGGRMVHLLGLMPVIASPTAPLPAAARAEEGFSVHAGLEETSALLFYRPTLVSDSYRSAESQPATSWADLVRIARGEKWPGYFGAPRLATASRGAVTSSAMAKSAREVLWKIVDGLDERQLLRFASVATSPENQEIDRLAIAREREAEQRQQKWLANRQAPQK
jgi:creatinine amidohydrolase/Fe(II)-dependent formamide hydrolase-like protein